MAPFSPPPRNNNVAQRRQRRLTLESVTTAPKVQPMRVLLYGVEKVGKTTFAVQSPSPILVGPEDGLPEDCQRVPRFPLPESWTDVLDALDELTEREHPYQTLVIDTVDWLEPLVWEHVCGAAKVASIEEVGGGYGKGYIAALDEWRRMLARLEALRKAREMHVILLGHAQIRAFRNPEGADYDRYSLKINEKAGGLLKEWCDAVLFANHETVAKSNGRNAKAKGLDTGARQIHTERRAAFDAGNRYSLPEVLPLDWEAFESAKLAGSSLSAEEYRTAIGAMLEGTAQDLHDRVTASVARAGENTAELARISNKLSAVLAKENAA